MAGPFGGALRGLMPNGGGAAKGMTGSGDWIYLVGITVLLVIILVLIGLIIREHLRRKKKK